MRTNLVTIEDLEDHAFYESGLSADGCLEHLDNYAREAIKKYGRILLTNQEERYISGFEGCCYACEPVGMLNQDLSEIIDSFYKIIQSIHTKPEFFTIKTEVEEALKLYKNKMEL
jgi:hypothetical protein